MPVKVIPLLTPVGVHWAVATPPEKIAAKASSHAFFLHCSVNILIISAVLISLYLQTIETTCTYHNYSIT
ncbi:hypothetical protein FLA_3477 [Filimonas lacunae]|nr:hypothetical protein FLA_3477 [Filimonas lacunae]